MPIVTPVGDLGGTVSEILKGGVWAALSLYLLWLWRTDVDRYTARLEKLDELALKVISENTAQMVALQGAKTCIYSRTEAKDIANEIERWEKAK